MEDLRIGQVAIVTVNFRAPHLTIECIDSLMAMADREWTVFVCENGSGDYSEEFLRRELTVRFPFNRPLAGLSAVGSLGFSERDDSQFLRVVLLVSPKNLGFAGGNNFAMRYINSVSCPRFYWILNNDTIVDPMSLTALNEKCRLRSDIGVCGSSLVYLPSKDKVQALGGAIYSPSLGRLQEIGQGMDWPANVSELEVERSLSYVSGASMFVPARTVETIGLLCEDYFLYFEESDYCLRIKRAGLRLAYAKESIVYHREGAVLGSGVAKKRSRIAEYFGLRSRLLFTWKHHRHYFPLVWIVAWLQALKRAAGGDVGRAKLMARVLLGIGKSEL
jgi:GT2 family glycosyltransferase